MKPLLKDQTPGARAEVHQKEKNIMIPHRCNTSQIRSSSERSSFCTLTNCRGVTLIELIVAFAIVGILATMALPAYDNLKVKAQNVRAMEEIRGIEKVVNAYTSDNGGSLPPTLADVRMDQLKDPWGNGYVYHRQGTAFPADEPDYTSARAIIPGTPINDDFDLFSKGRDGRTDPDITNDRSSDDIIRANEVVGSVSELW